MEWILIVIPIQRAIGTMGIDPYSSPFITRYSSFHALFHSFNPGKPKASIADMREGRELTAPLGVYGAWPAGFLLLLARDARASNAPNALRV